MCARQTLQLQSGFSSFWSEAAIVSGEDTIKIQSDFVNKTTLRDNLGLGSRQTALKVRMRADKNKIKIKGQINLKRR